VQAFEYRGAAVRLSELRADGSEAICAQLQPGGPPLPVCQVHPDTASPWLVEPGTRAVARALTPPMRPASVVTFGVLSWLSLLDPLALVLAVGYGGVRWARRTLLTRSIQCEFEAHLGLAFSATVPAAAYRSVRSFQISGNSTTSSILRR